MRVSVDDSNMAATTPEKARAGRLAEAYQGFKYALVYACGRRNK
jgi:hypothetical protein